MSRWTRNLELKKFITDDTSAKSIKECAEGLLAGLANTGCPTSGFTKALEYVDKDSGTALLIINDAINKMYD